MMMSRESGGKDGEIEAWLERENAKAGETGWHGKE